MLPPTGGDTPHVLSQNLSEDGSITLGLGQILGGKRSPGVALRSREGTDVMSEPHADSMKDLGRLARLKDRYAPGHQVLALDQFLVFRADQGDVDLWSEVRGRTFVGSAGRR